MRSLPSLKRLFLVAVLLPAAVSASNQLLFALVRSHQELRLAIYPWMAISTAVLSWCAGRYLSPTWLRWVVFGWCLVLLDCLTIAACLSGPMERYFSYVLLSVQIGLVALWAILGGASWQWRMPVVLVATAAVLMFAASMEMSSRRWLRNWDILMMLTTIIVLMLCGALRLWGFVLDKPNDGLLAAPGDTQLQRHQFGLKHMLIWAAAMVPILLVMRGFNFLLLRQLGAPDLFPLVLVAVVVATVNLIAIWAVLGQALAMARIAALVLLPYVLASGIQMYLALVESSYLRPAFTTGNRSYTVYARGWYDSLIQGLADSDNAWISWLWFNSALLAALLLFLRASGYKLVKAHR